MDTLSRRDLLIAGAASSLLLPSRPGWSQASDDAVTKFSFRAADSALADLKSRLAQARWPERETGKAWEQGVPLQALRDLTEYWRTGYDWRKCEAAMNRWPQFKTTIDGLGIHFLHVRSRHPKALPIVLTHGWPSTFLLHRELIGPLTDPVAHGGNASDAFDVIVPSLPGFGFSDKPTERGWNAERTARAWATLMTRLGYDRYVAQGGDWGAYVTTAMAQQRPAGLVAIHLNFPQTMPDVIPDQLTPEQQRALNVWKMWREQGSAYLQVQSTRPQTIGYSLADSPVGQAAWIYDIFDAGTGRTGQPEKFLSRDTMLDEITLYWLTNSSASSARFYLEQAELLGKRNNPGKVDLPVAVSVFPNDLPPVKSWAPLVYPNLYYWHELDRGGHFAQFEVPALFTDELRKAFRQWRAT